MAAASFTKDEQLRALHPLKKHLSRTLDLHAPETTDVLPADDFLTAYYTSLEDLESELLSILEQHSMIAVLALGRAGVGKTTFITSLLRQIESKKQYPFVRVPFIREGADSADFAELPTLLAREIVDTTRGVLTESSPSFDDIWLKVLAYAGSHKTFLPQMRDPLLKVYNEIATRHRRSSSGRPFVGWLWDVYESGDAGLQKNLDTLGGTREIRCLLQALSIWKTNNHTKYVHLFLDNIENARVFEAIQEMREALLDLPEQLAPCGRIILTMRYTSVRALGKDSDEGNAIQSSLSDERPRELWQSQKISLGAIPVETLHIPGNLDISLNRFFQLAQRIVAKRIALLSADDGPAFEMIAKECRQMVDDDVVLKSVAGIANYNLRYLGAILGNVIEARIDEGRKPFTAGSRNAKGGDGKERTHASASFLYEQIGYSGAHALSGCKLSANRRNDLMAVCDPVVWHTTFLSQGAKRALVDRLVLSSIHNATRKFPNSTGLQGVAQFGEIASPLYGLGYSEDQIASSLVRVCGDEDAAAYAESCNERFGLYGADPRSSSYTIMPMGASYLEIIGTRFGFWKGCIERAKYGHSERQARISSPSKHSEFWRLLCLRMILDVASLEVGFLWEVLLDRDKSPKSSASWNETLQQYFMALPRGHEANQGYALTALFGIADYFQARQEILEGKGKVPGRTQWFSRTHQTVVRAFAQAKAGVDPGKHMGSELVADIDERLEVLCVSE